MKWSIIVFCLSSVHLLGALPQNHSCHPPISRPPVAQVHGSDTTSLDTADIQDLYTDRLGDIYLVTTSGQLIKWAQDTFFTFYNTLGPITSIDVSNPFKILVFYRAYQQVITLDNHLSAVARLDLSSLNSGFISCLAMAKDDRIWIYSQDTKLLSLFHPTQLIVRTSDPIYYLKSPFSPTEILVYNEMVYLIDHQRGRMEFDPFGQYMGFDAKIPVHPFRSTHPVSDFTRMRKNIPTPLSAYE